MKRRTTPTVSIPTTFPAIGHETPLIPIIQDILIHRDSFCIIVAFIFDHVKRMFWGKGIKKSVRIRHESTILTDLSFNYSSIFTRGLPNHGLFYHELNRNFFGTFHGSEAINTLVQAQCLHVIRRCDRIARYNRTCRIRDITGIASQVFYTQGVV